MIGAYADITGKVLEIKLFSHACHKYDRELQAFTLVDTHNMHAVGHCFCTGFTVIKLMVFKLIIISDKPEQAGVACVLKIYCICRKHVEIRLASLSVREGGKIIIYSGPVINLIYQFRYR